jgi:predicted short-subunit dehydrogenase-like oxidoreductase (DUF2520 family)
VSTGFIVKGDPSVAIIGAGKVGTALYRALLRAGLPVRVRPARRGLPRASFKEDLLVLAVRESQLERVVGEIVDRRLVERKTAVVHCAGALGPEPLVSLRGMAAGVAQMHPMISFASRSFVPTLTRGQVHLDGDARAVRVARRVVARLGMTPRTIRGLDKVAYHAAAGLVANGAAALCAAGSELLVKGGVPPALAHRMLGPLLRSVADNVERLGLPDALTGPVRRGDWRTVARHLEVIESKAPHLLPLYRALLAAQLPLARKLGEGELAAWKSIDRYARGGA